jgi:DNA-binding transcriptional LysR family regulator
MIEISPLRYFVSAFELGTISAAAAAQSVSQPSLSQALQKLENRIGTPLFIRTRKGLRPTNEGRELYQHALSILTAVNQVESRFQKAGPVRVSFFTSPDILLVPFHSAFLALRRANPTLELRFETDATAAELALVDETCAPGSHKYHELIKEPYVFAVASSHPLAGMHELTLQQIRNETLIARRFCPSHDKLLRTLARDDLPFPICAEAVNDQQVLEMVHLGLGAALVPKSHVHQKQGISGISIRHQEPLERSVGIAVKKTAFADQMFHSWMTGWAIPQNKV